MTPVVLLHAFPLNHHLWAEQVEYLGRNGYRVIAPDLAGFGQSPLPAAPALLEIVEPVLADLDEPAVFVGLSMGGYLLMELLRKSPGSVAGAILVDTKATADSPEARAGRFEMAHAMDNGGDTTALADVMLANLLGETTRRTRPHVVAQVREWIEQAPAAAVATAQRAMADRPDSIPTLRTYEGPAAVVWGSEDVLSPPSEQRLMLEAMPQAVGRELPTVGHLSAVEDPAAVNDVLLDVLRDWLT